MLRRAHTACRLGPSAGAQGKNGRTRPPEEKALGSWLQGTVGTQNEITDKTGVELFNFASMPMSPGTRVRQERPEQFGSQNTQTCALQEMKTLKSLVLW